MKKIVRLLERIENEYLSWKELKDYCEVVEIDSQYIWNLLIDDKNKEQNKLVDEQHFEGTVKYRLNKRGLEFLQQLREKESWKPTKQELVKYFIGFVLGVITTLIGVWTKKL